MPQERGLIKIQMVVHGKNILKSQVCTLTHHPLLLRSPPDLPTREARADKAGSRDGLKRSAALLMTTHKYFSKSIAVLENRSQSLEPSKTFTGLLGDNQQTHL